jgi:PAS domain S-box-containing protein
MDDNTVKVLLVDDDEDDYIIVRDLLADVREKKFDVDWTATYAKAIELLELDRHHVYLLDYYLGAHTGLELLRAAVARGCQGPIIMLTGQGDHAIDLKVMQAGAADYLTKAELTAPLLERSIRYAIQHKLTEKALRESEARYRSLFANNHSVMLLIDPQTGDIVDANPSACAYYGYEWKELTRLKISQINTLPQDQVFQIMSKTVSQQQHFFHFRHRLADGSVRDVEVYSSPIQVGGKNLLYSIVHDVTGRKRAEEALQRSEAKFRALTETTSAGITIHQDGALRYMNPAAESLTGYSAGELEGKTSMDKILPLESLRILEQRRQADRRGEPVAPQFEARYLTKQGSERWANISVGRIEFEGHPAVLTTFFDITRRKQAEATLHRLVSGTSSATGALFFETLVRELAEWLGVRWAHVSELDPESPEQASPLAFWSDGRLASLQNFDLCGTPCEQTDQQGFCIFSSDVLRTFPNDSMLVSLGVSWYAGTPLQNSLGKTVGLLCAFHDQVIDTPPNIEEVFSIFSHRAGAEIARMRAETALIQTAADLQTRNEELDAFAHTVAHDLKNPLGLVVGYAESVEENYTLLPEEQIRRYLHLIAQSGRKMNNIIYELLLLASVRQVEDIATGPLDMADIVSEARERLVDLIAEHQAQIILPDTWPTALGYGPWIEEVWVNYLSNAVRYGGEPPRIELGATELSKHAIRFWIRDNGPGLTPKEQARLFKPFTSLNLIHAKGHGLGLSIVRRIVAKLGGQVGVESQPGHGSLFFFTLPAAHDKHDQ